VIKRESSSRCFPSYLFSTSYAIALHHRPTVDRKNHTRGECASPRAQVDGRARGVFGTSAASKRHLIHKSFDHVSHHPARERTRRNSVYRDVVAGKIVPKAT